MQQIQQGCEISKRRDPEGCLVQVFNSKLGHIGIHHGKCMAYVWSLLELNTQPTGLYYKCFTVIIYDLNVQFTIVMTVASTIKLRS